MTAFEISQLIIGSVAGLGVLILIFKAGGLKTYLDVKFKSIDKQFDKIDLELKEIKTDISDIKKDTRNIESRISRLEGLFEGWMFHDINKTGTEKNK